MVAQYIRCQLPSACVADWNYDINYDFVYCCYCELSNKHMKIGHLWSQNGDFKIWHPKKKKLALKTKLVLKNETLSLKHLY